MELVVLSLGVLWITFWNCFSHIFGKFARAIIAALFVGLAVCGMAVVLYTEPLTIIMVIGYAVGLIYYDFKRVYNNYGVCGDVFTFLNKEIVKVAVVILCMCIASRYAAIEFAKDTSDVVGRNLLSSFFEDNTFVKILYCLAMTGLIAIIDASKQSKVYEGFEVDESDPLLTGYVVGYDGKTIFGWSKLVIEVDLNEYKKQEKEKDIFAEYRNMDNRGTFDGNGRYVKYDYLGRRSQPDRDYGDVRCANKLAKIKKGNKGRIVYFTTAMRYNKSTYYESRRFLVRFNEQKRMLYVEDEVQSNKDGVKVCAAVALFAFLTCLTYFVRSL